MTWALKRLGLGKDRRLREGDGARGPGGGLPSWPEPPLVRRLREQVANPPDLVARLVIPEFGRSGPGSPVWVVFLSSLVDRRLVSEAVIRPLAQAPDALSGQGGASPRTLSLHVPHVHLAGDLNQVTEKLLDGWTAIVMGGQQVWMADTASRPSRQVTEPENETGVRLPREGFTEVLETNLALVRTRLRHRALRFEERRVGVRSGTRLVLAYIEDLIDAELLRTVRARLDRIRIDAVLESGYVEEYIEDSPFSPFPQTLRTERPDVVVANLLEGRFAILLDNTPFALVGPIVLIQLLGAPEDQYERFIIGTLIRVLRYGALAVSIVLPAVYVAVTTYHQEMIPTPLLLGIAAAREGVPFPALVEALIMELNFELLREAGLRLPRVVGPAVSIVGALVLGQAAITANLVSPAMVIVVAITGIASFATPIFTLAIAARMIRFAFTIAGAALGLFGVQALAVLLLVHLCALRSFGIPYLAPIAPTHLWAWGDVLVRAPRWRQTLRPRVMLPGDPVRAKGLAGRERR